ncbi:hypothetical protein ACFFRR_006440 [Megaselia abdita]
MKIILVTLALAIIGINAIPIEEVKLSKENFGKAVEHKLRLIKEGINCYYHGNISLIPGILGEYPKRIYEGSPNLFYDFNITRLELINADKFDVLKSEYDEATKKFELEIKFNEPYFQGAFHSNKGANLTFLGFHFEGKSQFKLRTFPAILKVGWTFWRNENTGALEIKDFHEIVEPIDEERKSVSIVKDFFIGSPSYIKGVKDALISLVDELYEGIDFVFDERSVMGINSYFKKYSAVEEVVSKIKENPEEGSEVYKMFDCLDKQNFIEK